ncbi:g2181 [Coccomyxa viridis]|uniref:G2181 protein n=1 Tax=Coccomyxa viridis TaxID=1274662 RepID=A0ABP1FQ72_9CHLO
MALLLVSCLLALSAGVSARTLQQAPAPAPMMAKGAVDGVMTVSAAQALFYNQSAIILSGLPNTTQYVSYPPMPKAGAVSQDTFTGPSFAGNGNMWLGSPQATLMGQYNGNMSSVLLQLDAPRRDAKLNTITFTYHILNSNSLPAANGTANTVAASSSMNLLPSVTPGSTLFYNATLAIDVVGIAKYVSMPQAGVKEGLIRVPLGWSGFYGY